MKVFGQIQTEDSAGTPCHIAVPRKGEIYIEDIAQYMQPGPQHRHLQRKQRFPLEDQLLQRTGKHHDLGKSAQKLYHAAGDALGGHLQVFQLRNKLLCRYNGTDVQLTEKAAEHSVADGILNRFAFAAVQVDEIPYRGKGSDKNTHRQDQLIQFGQDRAGYRKSNVLDDAAQQDRACFRVCHGNVPCQQIVRNHNSQQQQKAQRRKQPDK